MKRGGCRDAEQDNEPGDGLFWDEDTHKDLFLVRRAKQDGMVVGFVDFSDLAWIQYWREQT